MSVACVPFLPLGWLTWHGYRSEVVRVEEEIRASNQHIATLAQSFLDGMVQQVRDQAVMAVTREPGAPAMPRRRNEVRWEVVARNGTVLASQLEPGRVGRECTYRAELDGVAPGGSTMSRVGTWLPSQPPTVLLVARGAPDSPALVGAIDTEALHGTMMAWSGANVDRHVYAVDESGTLLFYSDLKVSRRGDDLRANPPISLFMDGGAGEIRYQSVVSGKERLGFVTRVGAAGWGLVVSADVGTALIPLQERYQALALSIAFAVAAALAIVLWASRRLAGPVLDIARALRSADRIGQAPLAVQASARQFAEYDELVQAMDELGAEIAAVEQELVQAEKASLLGQLASGLAHEMGTPLNVIIGNAQYLLRKAGPEDPARPVLQQVVKQAQRIAAMIRRLLDLSRPAAVRLAPVDVGAVIRQAVEVVPAVAQKVVVKIDVDADTPSVLADPKLLEHALLNLILNACQAMPDGGRLAIVAGQETIGDGQHSGAGIYLQVADTGSGIAPEHLGRVFEPFFTTKAHGQGTGLGLAIVERIIRQHGGHVSVLSRVGHGTVFTVRLCAALPQTQELTGGSPRGAEP